MNEAYRTLIESLEREIKAEERARRQQRREEKARQARPLRICLLLLVATIAFALPASAAQTVPTLQLLGTASPNDTVIQKDILDAVYPIGKVYISTKNLTPATQFGGTWAAVGEGRVLIGNGAGYASGAVGGAADGTTAVAFTGTTANVGGAVTLTGAATGIGAGASITGNVTNIGGAITGATAAITLAETNLPVHSHTMAHTHTIAHTHTYYVSNDRIGNPDAWRDHGGAGNYWSGNLNLNQLNRNTSTYSGNSSTSAAFNSGAAGTAAPAAFTDNGTGTAANLSGSARLNLPAAGLTGAASVTGTLANLTGNVTASGNVADNTMQPYLVVYMWQRTA
jgi:hypothetical protein